MVTKYGMSEKVGNISIDYEDDGRSLSSETRSAVEEEVCCFPVVVNMRAAGSIASVASDGIRSIHFSTQELVLALPAASNSVL